MDTKTNNLKKTVFLFLEGKLSRKEETELLEWIQKDTRHKQQFLEEQEALREKVIQSKNTRLDFQWKRLENRLSEEGHKEKLKVKRITFSRKQIISIAAAFVLGLFVSGIFYGIMSRNLPENSLVQEVFIPYGAKTNFTLPDGSVVWLNSGSKLMFTQDFENGRLVKLEGEGYFEVVKDKSTFIVETNYGNIEVLGTTFNLKAYADDDFQATLVEGKIKYNHKGIQPIILHPNQQLAINRNDQSSVNSVEVGLVTSWKDGKLIFKREPFEEVAKRLERWFNVNIDINNTEMKNLWFTGTIEMETLSEVMDLVSKSLPVKYSYNSKTRTVRFDKK